MDGLLEDVYEMNLSTVVFEVNLVGNPKEWWVDIGATRHVRFDRKMFSTYQEIENEEQLYMGNSSTSKVAGQGIVV